MDPWYEETSPSEREVEDTMQNSEVWICLHKKHNTEKEDFHLQTTISNILGRESIKNRPIRNAGREHISPRFQTITYRSIRRHPKWKEISDNILREEVVSHKPYGSWRGFSTFVMNPLREKYIIRVVREIWASYILDHKFIPAWLEHNYSPQKMGQGYQRAREHYEILEK